MKKLLFIFLLLAVSVYGQETSMASNYPNVVHFSMNGNGYLQLPKYSKFNPITNGIYADGSDVYYSHSGRYGDVDTLMSVRSYSRYTAMQQIQIAGQSVLITSGGTVDTAMRYFDRTRSMEFFYFTTQSAIDTIIRVSPFQVNDLIMCEQTTPGITYDINGNINNNGFLRKRLILKVDSVVGLRVYYTNTAITGAPTNTGYVRRGDVFARIGNTSLSSGRNSFLELTSTGYGAPYFRIVDSVNSWTAYKSVNSIKGQFGLLDSLKNTSIGTMFPDIGGYGLYTGNAYLRDGKLVLSAGGYIRSGKTSYADSTHAGFYFGVANGTPQAVIGDANSYIKYGGDSLKIKGRFFVTSATLNNQFNGINYTINSHGTQITQTLDSLRLLAYNQTWFNGRIASDSSSIVTLSNQITAKVSSTDFTGTNIISLINLAPGTATIAAKNIYIDGNAHFAANYDPTGKTTSSDVVSIINGTVTASYINAKGITANSIVANASITSPTITSGTFTTGASIGGDGYDITSSGFTSSSGSNGSQLTYNHLRFNSGATYSATLSFDDVSNNLYATCSNFIVSGNVKGTWAGNTISSGYLDLSNCVQKSTTLNGYSLSGNVTLNNIAVGISNYGSEGASAGQLAISSVNVYPVTLTINGVTHKLLEIH